MGEPGDGLRDPQVEATQAAHALAEHERQHVLGIMEWGITAPKGATRGSVPWPGA